MKKNLLIIIFCLTFLLIFINSVEAAVITVTIDNPAAQTNISRVYNFSVSLNVNTNISNVTWYSSTDGTTWTPFNSSINASAGATSFSVLHTTSLLTDNANYTFNATAYLEKAGSTMEAEDLNLWVGVDNTVPNVTLQGPINNTNATAAVTFVYNTSDSVLFIDNCSLYLYKSGTWELNTTDTSITEVSNQTFTVPSLEDGEYLWKVGCYDNANNIVNTTAWNITYDATAPTTGIISLPKYSSIFATDGIDIKCIGGDPTSGFITKIKLTKPSGKIVEAIVNGNEATPWLYTFKNKDTNEAGLYLVDCSTTNELGVSSKSAQKSFRVFFADSGGEDTGEPSPVAKLDVSTKDMNTGMINGKQGEAKTFTMDGTTAHTISFIEVGLTSATFTIESEPVEVTLNVGEYTNVDLDGDGKDDVKVTLSSIDDGLAKVEVINLEKLEEKREEERKASEPSVPTVTEEPSKMGLWITILVILVIIGVGYYFYNKSFKKGKK